MLFCLNQLNMQLYSTNSSIVPIKSYSNADTMKEQISLENKGKSGVYQWTNNINGKTYVGSSVNLNNRFHKYFSLRILEVSNMLICKAILKYGHSNFSLDILEYCDKSVLIEREQFYLNLLNPEYNILKNAYSLFGFNHSSETKEILSELKKGSNHFNFGKSLSKEIKDKISQTNFGQNNPFFGKTHNEDTKFKMSLSKLGYKHPLFNKNHSELTKEKISQSRGTSIYVYSLDHQLLNVFPSSVKASNHFQVSHKTILKYTKSHNIFQDKYILSLQNPDLFLLNFPPIPSPKKGGLISGTTILLKALDNLKKDQNNISQSITKNNNENNSISSIFELEYFNSLNSEQIILYCCLFFIILATYFFLGLIINIILKNYLNLEKYQWIQNNKIFKIIFSWYSSTNKIMFFIISFIILYSLIITIIALIFLINHYDQLHSIHNL